MSDFIARYKDLLSGLASLVAIVSFIFVFLASLASRKANIIKTAPLIIPKLGRDGFLEIENINGKVAYDVKSEPFYFTQLTDKDPFFPKGTYVFKTFLGGSGFIGSNPNSRRLSLTMDGEDTQDNDLMHYLWTRWISGTDGIIFFFKDAQNHRFAAKFTTVHEEKSDDFKLIYASKYVPLYRLPFWLIYGIRSLNTYAAPKYKTYYYDLKEWMSKRIRQV